MGGTKESSSEKLWKEDLKGRHYSKGARGTAIRPRRQPCAKRGKNRMLRRGEGWEWSLGKVEEREQETSPGGMAQDDSNDGQSSHTRTTLNRFKGN